MRVVVLGAVMALATSVVALNPAAAQSPTIFPMDAKAEAKLREVGVLLTFAAACVRYTTPDEEKMFKSLADGDNFTFQPGDEIYREEIKSLLNEVYERALKNPKLGKMTARACRETISEGIAALNRGG